MLFYKIIVLLKILINNLIHTCMPSAICGTATQTGPKVNSHLPIAICQ